MTTNFKCIEDFECPDCNSKEDIEILEQFEENKYIVYCKKCKFKFFAYVKEETEEKEGVDWDEVWHEATKDLPESERITPEKALDRDDISDILGYDDRDDEW